MVCTWCTDIGRTEVMRHFWETCQWDTAVWMMVRLERHLYVQSKACHSVHELPLAVSKEHQSVQL